MAFWSKELLWRRKPQLVSQMKHLLHMSTRCKVSAPHVWRTDAVQTKAYVSDDCWSFDFSVPPPKFLEFSLLSLLPHKIPPQITWLVQCTRECGEESEVWEGNREGSRNVCVQLLISAPPLHWYSCRAGVCPWAQSLYLSMGLYWELGMLIFHYPHDHLPFPSQNGGPHCFCDSVALL